MNHEEYRRLKGKAEELLAEAHMHSIGDATLIGVALAAEAQAWATLALAEATVSEPELEPYVSKGTGERLLVHPKGTCTKPCPVHAPSAHHMVSWPLSWNGARRRMERLCSHYLGHPDPDDLVPVKDHEGCDGCCRPST